MRSARSPGEGASPPYALSMHTARPRENASPSYRSPLGALNRQAAVAAEWTPPSFVDAQIDSARDHVRKVERLLSDLPSPTTLRFTTPLAAEPAPASRRANPGPRDALAARDTVGIDGRSARTRAGGGGGEGGLGSRVMPTQNPGKVLGGFAPRMGAPYARGRAGGFATVTEDLEEAAAEEVEAEAALVAALERELPAALRAAASGGHACCEWCDYWLRELLGIGNQRGRH
ncbi:hypothetical protein T492DRAFT_873430 [Pavlovales sp. CCMP2436]|nr:hypothetical protein T492DRAFT_873430 [Pavlovales sp. CCMP2436]